MNQALEVKTTVGPMVVVCYEQRAGLAITEAPRGLGENDAIDWGDRFGITHVPSGYLIPGRYERPEQARTIMRRLLSLGRWDGDKATVEAHFKQPRMMARMRVIVGIDALPSADTSALARECVTSQQQQSTPKGGNMAKATKKATKRTKAVKKSTTPKVARAKTGTKRVTEKK